MADRKIGRRTLNPASGGNGVRPVTLLTHAGGFTLLELLIVVFILAAIAFTTVSFTDNADSQFRYEDTQRRLQSIRRAIVGDSEPAFAGQRLLSGYVADNGVLPTTITNLVQQPPAFDTYGGQAPVFDPEPDANGYNNGPSSGPGAETVLTDPAETLFKGFRGSYLPLTPGTNPEFRDGWGNGTSGDPNFGWSVTVGSSITTIQSLGADGQSGGSQPFDQDIFTEIKQEDWIQDVQPLQIKVTNLTTNQNFDDIRASLLVYRINPTTLTTGWFRLTTTRLTTTLTPGNFELLNFPDPSLPTQIPIGQHLLVLVDDPNGIPHDTDDAPFTNGGNRVTKRVSFFPHTVLPDNIELVIQ